MRAFEFLTEYGVKKYRDGGKPEWYEKAVQLKTNNPHMSALEIGRQVGVNGNTILFWLTGKPDYVGRNIYNDNPPFTQKDFPAGEGTKKYFDGAKPWWYEEAIKLRKQGMMYKDIANKLSTPEESISKYTIRNWLVKGTKHSSGKLINPDAPFEPTFKRKKPIKLEVIYLSFETEKDYFSFIGYQNNQPPYVLDSKQIKRLITGNKMNKTWDNKLAKLLVNEIFYSDSIEFYGTDYGLKMNSVNQDCDSELKLINKPEKIF